MSYEFKIVKIIDEYTVIINAGHNDGIKIGDKFQILDKKGNAVLDPDTKEILGYLDIIKDTVTVSEIEEKMSFCTTPFYSAVGANLFASVNAISEAALAPRQLKLNIDLNEVTGGLRKSDEPVRVGDSVRLLKISN